MFHKIQLVCLLVVIHIPLSLASEIQIIGKDTAVPENKESDWIFGDYLLQNDHVVAVVAQPGAGRNANMTVRGVGACVIDLTCKSDPNDQLSAYYPTAGRFKFTQPDRLRFGVVSGNNDRLADGVRVEGKAVFLECSSTESTDQGKIEATVRYELHDHESHLRTQVTVRTLTDKPLNFPAYDGVCADRTFEFGNLKNDRSIAFCDDAFFGQTYGFVLPSDDGQLEWKSGRLRQLAYNDKAVSEKTAARINWRINLLPASSRVDLIHAVDSLRRTETAGLQTIAIADDQGPLRRAAIQLKNASAAKSGTVRLNDDGHTSIRLTPGSYQVMVTEPGYPETTSTIMVDEADTTHTLRAESPSCVVGQITDVEGKPIPCKVTFYGTAGLDDPDFGPDSAHGSVKNCVYAVGGIFRRPLPAGTYEVVVSRGPEYNAVFLSMEVREGKATRLETSLARVVDTAGWVSTELHSHSTPSGDNTSMQRGRVENLLCEHIEFGPCTEHNRISTYTPHLKHFAAEHLMATCTGMELTGSPLPVNHQNAFPLKHHPHTQDGGGPTTDPNPVIQIERLAMWDDGSEKVVQGNHPNIRQQYGDRDTDGKPDEGFRRMFGLMDVIEVHPPAAIFQTFDMEKPDPGNRMLQWMQLLNQGMQLPGVVNTDAHYNHHGSGWLRNWFESSSDDPATIEIDEMIHAAEHGHIIMSTGPFMTVKVHVADEQQTATAIPGENVAAINGNVNVAIRIQCPNWIDVNRVQIFLNGRSGAALNFTRREHPELFADGVVKFDQTIPLLLRHDTHVIVATIGQGLSLGRVMGEQYGAMQPCAVGNPIWVDVDGNGFTHNHDGFGVPLPGAIKPHRHQHP